MTTFFGLAHDQFYVAPLVKGNDKDKNVSPAEMRAFLIKEGLNAIVRVNGTREQMQRLLASGIPVIVHQWLAKPGGELVGHYRVLQGYDLAAGVFVTSDPYTPPRKAYTYADFDRYWKPWNRRYIVAYKSTQEGALRAALGRDFDVLENGQRALVETLAAAQSALQDSALWFNLGDDRLAVGDAPGAVEAYDKARALGLPPTFAWYNFGPFEALHKIGGFQRMLDLSEPMLVDASGVEEIRYWRGRAFAGLGRKDEARAEFEAAVNLNAAYEEARSALAQLR